MELFKSKHNLILSFILSYIFISCSSTTSEVSFRVEKGYALGTTYTIKYEVTDDEQNLKPLIEAVFDTVNMSMSTYLPTSDISAINRGDSTIVVDKYFKEVYIKAKEVHKKTEGFF